MLKECPECGGEGLDLTETRETPCPLCKGACIIEEISCDLCFGEGCERCDLKGILTDIECPQCETSGTVHVPIRCKMCQGRRTIPSFM